MVSQDTLLPFLLLKMKLTLVGADNNQSTLFRVNSEELICMAMSLIIALVVVVDLVQIYNPN